MTVEFGSTAELPRAQRRPPVQVHRGDLALGRLRARPRSTAIGTLAEGGEEGPAAGSRTGTASRGSRPSVLDELLAVPDRERAQRAVAAMLQMGKIVIDESSAPPTACPRGDSRMSRLRINITMSLDGYVAGPDQSLEDPLGKEAEAIHEWMFATRSWREQHGLEGERPTSTTGMPRRGTRTSAQTIMGRNMFGPIRARRQARRAGRGWW